MIDFLLNEDERRMEIGVTRRFNSRFPERRDSAARTTAAGAAAAALKTWDIGDPLADDRFSDDGNCTFPPEYRMPVLGDSAPSTSHPCLW